MHALKVDLRSLALFRIVLGLIVVFDVIVRFTTVSAMYTDSGVLPREAYIPMAKVWPISLHFISGQFPIIAALFALTLLAAIGMTVGYRTKLCTALTWFLVYSMHARNDFILYGGDFLLVALLFWAMFSPISIRLSVDALNSASEPKKNECLAIGPVALLLQIVMMYLFTGVMKSDPIWWSEGSALYYTFNLDVFVTPLGRYLLHFPKLLQILTWVTLALELIGPLVALVFTGWTRLLIALSFMVFHFAHFITLDLGIFPFISICGWLPFLPKQTYSLRPAIWFIDRCQQLTQMAWRALPKRAPAPAILSTRTRGFIVGFCLLLVFTVNLSRVKQLNFKLPPVIRHLSQFLGLSQNWNMFAPYPMRGDGWFVFHGILRDGTQLNPFHGGDVTFERPPNVSGTYKNYVWFTYLNNLWHEQEDEPLRYFGKYLCRTWNKSHSDENQKLLTVDIYYMLELTPPPGKAIAMPDKRLLWKHECYANDTDAAKPN